MNIAVGVHLTL